MLRFTVPVVALVISTWAGWAAADWYGVAIHLCVDQSLTPNSQSFGIDFVDGGSYFINQSSVDQFTFLTQFEGCVSQGSITPILVDPSGNGYFCTDIATSPDDTSFVSTWYVESKSIMAKANLEKSSSEI